MNPLVEVFKSQEERDRLRTIEQLRRKGEKFIRVRYIGQTIPQIDNEGLCYNIRMHGLQDIEAYESTNMNDGKIEYKTRPGSRVLFFRQTGSGDVEASIWDDPRGWNRRYIFNHPDDLEVLDKDILDQIEEESKTPFKTELTRKETLEKEIAEKVRELSAMDEQEQNIESKTKKRKRPKSNGSNESTSGVDSSGVPRVAAGRYGEGDSSSI